MPGFVLDRARQIGLNPDTALFNKQNQDKLGILLINQDGYQSWKKGNMSVEDFAYNLAGTWRGLPEGPSNLTYQDQFASRNKAHAKWNDVIAVLKGSKSVGSVATGRGVDLGSSYSTANKSDSLREGDTNKSPFENMVDKIFNIAKGITDSGIISPTKQKSNPLVSLQNTDTQQQSSEPEVSTVSSDSEQSAEVSQTPDGSDIPAFPVVSPISSRDLKVATLGVVR